MRAFAEWLYGTAPSAAIHSTFWLIRLLQAAHLLTAAVVVGSGVMIALRAAGWRRADEPFETVWKRFAPWLAWGLAVMGATGLAQTLGDPVRAFTSTSYWVKLALLLGGVMGTLSLAGVARRAPPRPAESSFAAKLAAGALILCWLALPLLGRMIGYDLAIWGRLSLRI
jgi:putative copper export protein